MEVDQELFREFAPPEGSFLVGLELIRITAEKKSLPRLANRRIQVPGRRTSRFLPPRWKPATQKRGERRKF
jgi:hypothetical protein